MSEAAAAKADLPYGVRLADDSVCKMRVLLGPERAQQLNRIRNAILTAAAA